jgi:hypothetical protein
MKKIAYYIFLSLMFFASHSCEIDNYGVPDATLQGKIIDTNGRPLQVQQGGGSLRLRLDELSWENSLPLYFNMMQDGTFSNTKIFAATYRITPVEGPFYPLNIEADGKVVEVKGTTTVDFTVTPYLNVEWVSEPSASDGIISASFRFTRNPSPNGTPRPNVKDYQLFISNTQYVGNNNYDATIVEGVRTVNNDSEGQTISIATKVKLKRAVKYWVRIGVRCDDSYSKYNYTDIKTVDVGL